MHLIATGGGATVDTNPHDESIGVLPTTNQVQDEQPVSSLEEEEDEDDEEHEPIDDGIPEVQQSQLPLVNVPSSSVPMDVMDTEPQVHPTHVEQSQPEVQPQPAKTQHNIAEIHREMLILIPIPQAWSHIRHQSGLFSYPDLPHFNVIRQATFREGRFVCPFCTVDFASKEGIRYHLYNSCTKSPYPKAFFRCLMCGSELADRSSLRTHLARHVSDHHSK